jgi:tetratricopeptide (TPR) repeat protein
VAEPGTTGAGWGRAAPWLAAGAVLVAFAGALGGPFQFDDWNVIVDDPRVGSLGAWWRSMPGIRPVLKLSYAVNHASGLGVAGFHALNVAIHAANAALALLLVRRLEERLAGQGPPGAAVPGVAALLFALHPVQTEAVTYVSGRSASLAGAFALGAVLLHVAGRDGAPRWLSWAGAPALFALALGTREQAVALPFVLLAVDAADARRPFSWRAALRATAGHWLVLAAAGAAFLASPVYRGLVAESLALRGPWANLLTHLRALAWLGGQVLWPGGLEADPVLPVVARLDAPTALAGAGVLATLAGGIALLRRRPAVALALLWTLLWLPLAGWWLPRPEPANDRQLYLALLGPAWLLARALAGGEGGRRWRRAVAGALVAALAFGTVARNRIYADEVTFWAAATEATPRNARAWNNLGFALAGRCRTAEAEAALRRAVELDPDGFRAAMNLELLRNGEPLGPREPACP